MPEVTEHQLQRLHSAAEEIQRVISEIQSANAQAAPETTRLIRYAAASPAPAGATAGDNEIIVAGEPE